MTFVCQRCLEPVDIDVDATVDLALVHEDDTATQDSEEDYLELNDEGVELTALVEDELILALPIIAVHSEGACEAIEPVARESEKFSESPFAVLSSLKRQS